MAMLLLTALAAASIGSSPCFATAREVPAGTALAASDVTPVACRSDAPRAPLRYDAVGRVTVTAAALPAGAYLGRLAPLSEGQIVKGAPLTLRSAAGPVLIERQVTAMQPGRSGERVFVRDSSGKVFAVPLEVHAQ